MSVVIGITSFTKNISNQIFYTVVEPYVNAVKSQGALPFIIPANTDIESVKTYANIIDGLLIPGGEDVSPLNYNMEPHPSVTLTLDTKDIFEIALIKEMKRLNKPVLGICRGMQIINVAFGGGLIQDIPSQTDSFICHKQAMEIRSETTHTVNIEKSSKLYELLGNKANVNSYHHQAVGDVAPGFTVSAKAPDGIIEAIESEDKKILAVQWHPECLFERYNIFCNIFKYLIDLAE